MGLPRADSSLLHEGRRRPPLISHQQPNPASPFRLSVASGVPVLPDSAFLYFHRGSSQAGLFSGPCFALKPFRALTPSSLLNPIHFRFFPIYICAGGAQVVSPAQISPLSSRFL